MSGGPRPTVLLVEDAHWADEATLDLIRYLGRRISQTRALFVVTYRNDEVGRTHPLRVVIGDLATAAGVRRVNLSPLSEQAVRRLAAGSTIDGAALHRRTGGNPFFVTEILAVGDQGIPANVRDAVLARATRLSPPGYATLEVAAVIGSPVESWLLQDVARPDAGAVDECIARGMLASAGQSLVFRHELARQAILEEISPARRTAHHAHVLGTLSAMPDDTQDLARLAHHAEYAGNRETVLRYAPAAARRAAQLRAHREAADQYARALRFAGGLPPAERAALLEAFAGECQLTGRLSEGITARREAIDLRRAQGDDHADAAREVLAPSSAVSISRIMALVALGRLRARRGDPEQWSALDDALELAGPTGTLQRLAPVHAARAEAAWLAGDHERTAQEAGAAFDLAVAHEHRWFIGELGFWLWRAGALAEPPPGVAEPFRLQIAGDWRAAADAWAARGCPYETARALADAEEETPLRDALATFESLGARPSAAVVTRRLRELGVRQIPRGPRPATKAHPAGLTARETEVLALIVEGCGNPEIAARLFLSTKTIEHHVSAVLAKLDVDSREAAARKAMGLGVRSPSGDA